MPAAATGQTAFFDRIEEAFLPMTRRKCLAFIISVLPTNGLRIFFYRRFFGYKIEKTAKIGPFVLIDIAAMTLGKEAVIRRSSCFEGPFSCEIGEHVTIGSRNVFFCGDWTSETRFKHHRYAKQLVIGEKALITNSHYFDLVGRIEIGANSWVAGRDSQFWTHGINVMDRDISIGKGCYIGSGVKFSPGSGVGDGNIIALGSVVTKTWAETDHLIAGAPARPIKSIAQEKREGHYLFSLNDG